MSDYLLELEVKLNSNNVLDKFESKAIATGKKIEQTLSNALKSGLSASKIRLDIDTSGIKAATGEMKLFNKEISLAVKGMKSIGALPRFSTGSSPKSPTGTSSNSAAAQQKAQEVAAAKLLNAELKRRQQELTLIAKLERDVVSARVSGAKADNNKALQQRITLEREALRHAQLLSKINASPLSPKAVTEARNLATALNSINVNRIKSEFAGLEGQATKSFGRISNLAANVAGGVAGAIASAGLNVAGNVIGAGVNAVTSTVGGSIATALDFNSTMNMIKIGAQATAEEMTKLNTAVMAASTQFGVAPAVMANLSLELGRMGVNAQQLPEYLTAIGNSAQASGEDVNKVKDIIASTNAVFSELSVAKVGDLLTVGANISPGDLNSIGQALSYVGPSAKDAGVSLETLIEQIVILQTAGFGEHTGSSLAALYTDIKENSGVFEELGVEIFDISGKMRDIQPIIAELGAKLKAMSGEQRALALQPLDTQSVRALQAMGLAYQDNTAKIKENRKQLEAANGISAKQGALAMEDPKAKIAQVQAQIDQLRIALGKAFIPAVEGAADFGSQLAEALLSNTVMFDGLTQASEEFQSYLEQNPQLVQELASSLGEVAVILSQTVLTETRKLLEYLEQNPKAIQQALEGMVEFAQNLAAAVKMAADLAGALKQAYDWDAKRRGAVVGNAEKATGIDSNGDGIIGAPGEQAQSGFASAVMGAAGGGAGGMTGNGAVAEGARMAVVELKKSEGFRANPYDDGMGVSTIGYGETRPDIVARGSITEPEAAKLMVQRLTDDYLKPALALIPEQIRSQLTAGQIAAIGSFAYNTGVGGFQDSSFGRSLIGGDISGARAALPTSYINEGTGVEQGLRNRRQGELALFNSADTPSAPSTPVRAPQTEGTITVGGQTMTIEEYNKRAATTPTAPSASSLPTTPFSGIQITSAVDASGEPGLDYVVNDGERGAKAGAVAAGEVIETVTGKTQLTDGSRGYGNQVIVRTLDEKTGEYIDMLYAHFDDVLVKVGDEVGIGTVLGTQGRTGSTTGAHVSLDFFGKDSAQTTPAALAMRDRVAQQLASNPDSLNQKIGATSANGLTRLDSALTPAERRAKKEEADRKRLADLARKNDDEATRLQRQQQEQARESERKTRRLAIETSVQGLQGTPFEATGQRQLAAFDLRDRYQQEIDSKKQELEDLQRESSRLEDRKGEPGIQAVADEYKNAITQLQSYISTLGEQYQQESKNLEQSNSAAIAQNELAARSEMAANRSARASRTMALEIQAFVGTIKDPALQAFFQMGFDQEAKGNSYAEEIRVAQEEAAKLEAAIKALQDAGLDLNSPDLQLAQEQLADLRDTVGELQSNRDLEFNISVTGQADILQQFKTRQQSDLNQAQVSVLQQRGDTFGANALQREQGVRNQAASYFDQRSSIEALRGQVPETEINGMLSSLEQLNDVSLEGINNQFMTLNETMMQTGKQALGGFIGDLMKGKDAGDAFKNAIDGLASSLIDMLLNQAMQSIFSGGIPGMGGGQGGGGIFGSIIGGLTGGLSLYEGNVPSLAGGTIDEAFRQEKARSTGKPYLAVLNDQELVLSSKQSQRFMDLGLNKAVAMAGGNVPTTGKSGMGTVNLNMPMSLSLGSDEGGGGQGKSGAEQFAKGLQKKMQQVAFEEIAKARRPNGQLWNGGIR